MLVTMVKTISYHERPSLSKNHENKGDFSGKIYLLGTGLYQSVLPSFQFDLKQILLYPNF